MLRFYSTSPHLHLGTILWVVSTWIKFTDYSALSHCNYSGTLNEDASIKARRLVWWKTFNSDVSCSICSQMEILTLSTSYFVMKCGWLHEITNWFSNLLIYVYIFELQHGMKRKKACYLHIILITNTILHSIWFGRVETPSVVNLFNIS